MSECDCVLGYEPVARPIKPQKGSNTRPGAFYYHVCTHKSKHELLMDRYRYQATHA